MILGTLARAQRMFAARIGGAVVVMSLTVASPALAQNLFWGEIGQAGGTPNNFFSSDLNGAGLTNILVPRAMVISVDVDAAAGRVFWEQFDNPATSQYSVHSAALNGSSPTTIASFTGGNYGLAVDSVNQRLYWTDGSKITRTDYNGANPITIATSVWAQAIEVDPVNGKVFWADQGYSVPTANLMMANLDGTSPQSLGSFNAITSRPSGLTVNPNTQTLYWSDNLLGTVNSIPYAGGASTLIHSGLIEPAGLDLELTTNRLYIVEKGTAGLSWSNPAGGPLTSVFLGIGQNRGEMWDVAAIVPAPGIGSFALGMGLLGARRRRG